MSQFATFACLALICAVLAPTSYTSAAAQQSSQPYDAADQHLDGGRASRGLESIGEHRSMLSRSNIDSALEDFNYVMGTQTIGELEPAATKLHGCGARQVAAQVERPRSH